MINQKTSTCKIIQVLMSDMKKYTLKFEIQYYLYFENRIIYKLIHDVTDIAIVLVKNKILKLYLKRIFHEII
jgi:hypothetical protein